MAVRFAAVILVFLFLSDGARADLPPPIALENLMVDAAGGIGTVVAGVALFLGFVVAGWRWARRRRGAGKDEE